MVTFALLFRSSTTPLEISFCARKCREMAARADCCRTSARSHSDFDALLVGTEVGVLVDKTSETMAVVWNRDQFHGAEAGGAESLP